MPKQLFRLCMLVICAVSTVFITACPPFFGPGIGGTVVDERTKQGIEGIRVSCIMTNGPAEFVIDERQTSGPDDECSDASDGLCGGGDFSFRFKNDDYSCQMLRFTDVDGEENGSYKELTIWVDEFECVVELEPVD